MKNKILTCSICECTTYKLLPHPQDKEQEPTICEDCEYAVIAQYDSLEDEPLTNYKDIRGV